MEYLVLFVVGWFIWRAFKSAGNSRSSRSDLNASSHSYQTSSTNKHKPTQKTFNVSKSRQRTSTTTSKIKFGSSNTNEESKITISCSNCSSQMRIPSGKNGLVTCPYCSHNFEHTSISQVENSINLDGINDAFTGVQIDQTRPIYSCDCGVFYQEESFELLREENGSRCVACSKANITAYSSTPSIKTPQGLSGRTRSKSTPRNYSPTSITLNNYKCYVNQVVTFEGYVHSVKVSRRGSDFAVMFENKSWTKGFKLVFFKGSMRKVGGASFVNSMKGKHIKVRGLLINHETFGYEIIINDPAMILEIS